MIDKIFDMNSNQIVKKVLDYSAARQRVIANNVANVRPRASRPRMSVLRTNS